MNKYTIGAILLGVAFVAVVYAQSNRSTTEPVAAQTNASVVTVAEDRYDFGEIDIFGGKVETTYTLKNEGPDDITITGAQTSCMCTEGEIAGYTFGMHGSEVHEVVIPAGAEEEIRAVFDPLAHGPNGTGKITRELMLKTNSTESPQIELRFSGNVVKNEE